MTIKSTHRCCISQSAVTTVAALFILLANAGYARATWSIILVDTSTKEIAVGSATCLQGFDLLFNLPVVSVDIGAGCAQSLVDVGAVNRAKILAELNKGTPPIQIIDILAAGDTIHQNRQYGIVDTFGRKVSFTGTGAGAYAGGVVGKVGNIVYAIQGNVLTGAPVVAQAELALLNSTSDMPGMLMEAMEAARAMGGDGRCSCSVANPTQCGSPPPVFTKSAHIAFMFGTRLGDTNGVCNSNFGCANGDYFYSFNMANQFLADPDPVVQLQAVFDDWRQTQVGRVDAVQSQATLDKIGFLADGTGTAELTFTLNDWQGIPVDPTGMTVTVTHAPDSAATTTIGPVEPISSNIFRVEITGSQSVGVDRYYITVDDGIRAVILLPAPTLTSAVPPDLDLDGDVDILDGAILADCLSGPNESPAIDCIIGDFDGKSTVDLRDVALFELAFTASPCKFFGLGKLPLGADIVPCQGTIVLTADVEADPEPSSYQWYFDGNPIPGATSKVFTKSGATAADKALYSVTATSTCGSATSQQLLVRIVPSNCQ